MTTEVTGSAGTNTEGAGPGSTEGEGKGTLPPTDANAAAGGAKEGEGAKGDDLEFDVPEGIELDKASVDEFKTILKDAKLDDKARAKALVDLAIKREQARADAHVKLVASWAESVKADKEIGGDALAENLATAKKAIDLGPPELKGLLQSTGLGNHPVVVKWALAIGKRLSEDKFVPGTKAAPAPTTSQADRLYPKTAQSA